MDKKLHQIHQKQFQNKVDADDFISPGCKKINVIRGVLSKRFKATKLAMNKDRGSIS